MRQNFANGAINNSLTATYNDVRRRLEICYIHTYIQQTYIHRDKATHRANMLQVSASNLLVFPQNVTCGVQPKLLGSLHLHNGYANFLQFTMQKSDAKDHSQIYGGPHYAHWGTLTEGGPLCKKFSMDRLTIGIKAATLPKLKDPNILFYLGEE